jgi:cystathionine beta-lyase
MMNFDFDTIIDRRCSESAKYAICQEDQLPMWVADMDFRSPEPVIQALHDRIDHGVFGYGTLPEGSKEAVISWLSNRHGWDVTPDDILFVPGVVAGFNLAAHAVTRPGDGVVLQTPAYGPFFSVASNSALIQQEMELPQGADGQYYIDFDVFEDCLNGRSRIFMLCNPQNPTGRVFTQNELIKIAEICLQYNLTICADEIHSDLVYSSHKHIPIASLSPQIASQTITLIAPSKTFNIAGLKASVAIITNKELRTRFENARKGLLGSVNLLGLHAARAAYLHGQAWLEALLVYLQANRDFAADYIYNQVPGIKMIKPEGTHLAWLDCRESGIEGSPGDFFEKEAGVVLNDGSWFGKGGQGFVRLNFACPRSVLKDGLTRIKEALAALQG